MRLSNIGHGEMDDVEATRGSGMSYVIAAPEYVAAAAMDLTNIGSTISDANSAAMGPVSGVVPAGADEVSTGIASLFEAHAQAYQAISAAAQAFHAQFVQFMSASAEQYALAEAANGGSLQSVGQSVLSGGNAPSQALNAASTAQPLMGGAASAGSAAAGVPAATAGVAGGAAPAGTAAPVAAAVTPASAAPVALAPTGTPLAAAPAVAPAASAPLAPASAPAAAFPAASAASPAVAEVSPAAVAPASAAAPVAAVETGAPAFAPATAAQAMPIGTPVTAAAAATPNYSPATPAYSPAAPDAAGREQPAATGAPVEMAPYSA